MSDHDPMQDNSFAGGCAVASTEGRPEASGSPKEQRQQNSKGAGSKGKKPTRRSHRPNHPFQEWHVRLNAKICHVSEKGGVPELLNLAEAHHAEMNCVNVSTLLHRLARLAKKDHTGGVISSLLKSPKVDTIRRKIAAELQNAARDAQLLGPVPVSTAGDVDMKFNPRCFSTIAWSYATLQIRDERAFHLIASLSMSQLVNFKSFEIANMMWAFAKMRIVINLFLEAVAVHTKDMLSSYSSVSLATMTWAYATLQPKPPVQFLKALSAAFVEHLESAGSQEMANMAWACATTKIVDVAMFEDLGNSAASKLTTFSIQELTNTAWAFSRAGVRHDTFFAACADLFTSTPGLVVKFHAQGLANLMWALAKQTWIGGDGHKAVLVARAIMPACQSLFNELKPQELSSILWSCAKLGFKQGAVPEADQLFAHVASLPRERLRGFSMQGMANTLYAYTEFMAQDMTPFVSFLSLFAGLVLERVAQFEDIGLLYIFETTQLLLSLQNSRKQKNKGAGKGSAVEIPHIRRLSEAVAVEAIRHIGNFNEVALVRLASASVQLNSEARANLVGHIAKQILHRGVDSVNPRHLSKLFEVAGMPDSNTPVKSKLESMAGGLNSSAPTRPATSAPRGRAPSGSSSNRGYEVGNNQGSQPWQHQPTVGEFDECFWEGEENHYFDPIDLSEPQPQQQSFEGFSMSEPPNGRGGNQKNQNQRKQRQKKGPQPQAPQPQQIVQQLQPKHQPERQSYMNVEPFQPPSQPSQHSGHMNYHRQPPQDGPQKLQLERTMFAQDEEHQQARQHFQQTQQLQQQMFMQKSHMQQFGQQPPQQQQQYERQPYMPEGQHKQNMHQAHENDQLQQLQQQFGMQTIDVGPPSQHGKHPMYMRGGDLFQQGPQQPPSPQSQQQFERQPYAPNGQHKQSMQQAQPGEQFQPPFGMQDMGGGQPPQSGKSGMYTRGDVYQQAPQQPQQQSQQVLQPLYVQDSRLPLFVQLPQPPQQQSERRMYMQDEPHKFTPQSPQQSEHSQRQVGMSDGQQQQQPLMHGYQPGQQLEGSMFSRNDQYLSKNEQYHSVSQNPQQGQPLQPQMPSHDDHHLRGLPQRLPMRNDQYHSGPQNSQQGQPFQPQMLSHDDHHQRGLPQRLPMRNDQYHNDSQSHQQGQSLQPQMFGQEDHHQRGLQPRQPMRNDQYNNGLQSTQHGQPFQPQMPTQEDHNELGLQQRQPMQAFQRHSVYEQDEPQPLSPQQPQQIELDPPQPQPQPPQPQPQPPQQTAAAAPEGQPKKLGAAERLAMLKQAQLSRLHQNKVPNAADKASRSSPMRMRYAKPESDDESSEGDEDDGDRVQTMEFLGGHLSTSLDKVPAPMQKLMAAHVRDRQAATLEAANMQAAAMRAWANSPSSSNEPVSPVVAQTTSEELVSPMQSGLAGANTSGVAFPPGLVSNGPAFVQLSPTFAP